jgi:hypothetical protein
LEKQKKATPRSSPYRYELGGKGVVEQREGREREETPQKEDMALVKKLRKDGDSRELQRLSV